jgi:hypothetical protein
MEQTGTAKKMIAVSDSAERESYFLKLILSSCGHGAFSAAPASGASNTSVLLSPEASMCPNPARFPVWVVRYPDTGSIDRRGYRKVITYSVKYSGADFTARNIRTAANHTTSFEISGVGIIGRVHLRTAEKTVVEAALAAATAAIAAGVPFADALEALNSSGPLKLPG